MTTEFKTPLQLIARFIEPLATSFTVESAQQIAAWRADAEIQERLDELADKGNEGLLTTEERREYQEWVEAIDLVTLMQLKARSFLKRTTAT